MPRLSLLVMLDGEASDSAYIEPLEHHTLTGHLAVDEFELESAQFFFFHIHC